MTTQLISIPELLDNVEIHMATVDPSSVHPNQMQHSICLIGAPGTAKTYTATHQMRDLWAARHGCAVEECAVLVYRCAGNDPSEFIGMGIPQKEELLERYKGQVTTRKAVPDMLVEIERARMGFFDPATGLKSTQQGKPAKCVIVVLDELLQASAAIQTTLSSFVYRAENTLGGFDAGPNICVVMTGNRSADKSGAGKMLAHLRDRAICYELLGYKDKNNKANTEVIKSYIGHAKAVHMHPLLIQYVSDNIETAPWDDVMENDRSHMTFRSFTGAAQTIAAYFEAKGTLTLSETMTKGIAAIIGTRGAASVRDFLESVAEGVPTMEAILANPLSCPVPDGMGAQVAAGSVAIMAVEDTATAEAALAYVTRGDFSKDLQVQLMGQIIAKSASGGFVLGTELSSQFMADHPSLVALINQL
jgi:hypothetical protein